MELKKPLRVQIYDPLKYNEVGDNKALIPAEFYRIDGISNRTLGEKSYGQIMISGTHPLLVTDISYSALALLVADCMAEPKIGRGEIPYIPEKPERKSNILYLILSGRAVIDERGDIVDISEYPYGLKIRKDAIEPQVPSISKPDSNKPELVAYKSNKPSPYKVRLDDGSIISSQEIEMRFKNLIKDVLSDKPTSGSEPFSSIEASPPLPNFGEEMTEFLKNNPTNYKDFSNDRFREMDKSIRDNISANIPKSDINDGEYRSHADPLSRKRESKIGQRLTTIQKVWPKYVLDAYRVNSETNDISIETIFEHQLVEQETIRKVLIGKGRYTGPIPENTVKNQIEKYIIFLTTELNNPKYVQFFRDQPGIIEFDLLNPAIPFMQPNIEVPAKKQK